MRRAAAAATSVGRGDERALVAALLRDAIGGCGGVVLVEGEAGIGKTHLLGIVHDHARSLGMTVLAGECSPFERARPFGPFEPVLGSPLSVAQGPATRFAVQEAILDDLTGRAAAAPVLLSIDDLQWADEPSLAVLAALARRAGDLPLAVVGAHRPTPPLPAAVVDVLAARSARMIRLAPLAPHEVDELVAGVLGVPPAERLRALVDGAGGNPFLLIELLRALDEANAIAVDGAAATTTYDGLPPTLRHTVLHRVRALSPSLLDVLRAASVLGGSFHLADLAAVLDRPAVSLHQDVVVSIDAGLLEEHASQLRFRHELLREAIYTHIPIPIRANLHAEAARILGERGAPAVVVAGHLIEADDAGLHDAAGAVERFADAAHEVAASDPHAALLLADRALARTTGAGPDDLVALRITLLAATGRLTDAERAARQALAPMPAGAGRRAVELALAEVLLQRGNAGEAAALLEELAGSLALDDPARARVLADAGWARLVTFDLDGADRDAAAAVEAAAAVGDAPAVTSGLAVRCRVAAFRVEFDRSIELGRRAVEASADGGAATAQRVPHYYLGLSLLNADRFDDALAVLDEGRRVAEAAGLAAATAMYHAAAVTCGFHGGRWDEATVEAEAARLLRDDTGTRRGAMQTEAMLGLLCFHRGDEAAARDALARAEADLAVPGHDAGGIIWLLWLRAALAESAGDVAEAARLLGSAFDLSIPTGVASVQLWFGPEVVRLYLATGDGARAAAVAAEVARAAACASTASATAAAHLCCGLVDRDPARLALAAAEYARSPRRLDLAGALEAEGRVRSEEGERAGAVACFDRSLSVLDEIGAERDARRVHEQLRQLGVRRGARGERSRPASGLESLTPAERHVLRLVGDGLANADIADRLFVSRRTVETHVGRLYAKLGVRGRVALAQLANHHR